MDASREISQVGIGCVSDKIAEIAKNTSPGEGGPYKGQKNLTMTFSVYFPNQTIVRRIFFFLKKKFRKKFFKKIFFSKKKIFVLEFPDSESKLKISWSNILPPVTTLSGTCIFREFSLWVRGVTLALFCPSVGASMEWKPAGSGCRRFGREGSLTQEGRKE